MAFSFKDLTEPLILDGATGTQLQKRGMPSGVCGEEWILAHPETMATEPSSFSWQVTSSAVAEAVIMGVRSAWLSATTALVTGCGTTVSRWWS